MRLWLPVVIFLAMMAAWAALQLLRRRRTRYLQAHRPRIMKESLDRARAKQAQRRERGAGAPPGEP